ncbi:MAG: DNA-3-methyladenine glycosylase family protein [Candidatus Helarchaeota archaeon]
MKSSRSSKISHEKIEDELILDTPYSLDLTINSGHSSFPAPTKMKQGYLFLIPLESENYPVSISQKSPKIFQIKIYLLQENHEESRIRLQVKQKLTSILGFDEKLDDFYGEFSDSKIKKCMVQYRGMSLTKPIDLFESLTCSVLTQNCSIEQWTRVVRAIKKNFCTKLAGFDLHSFLTPECLCSQDLDSIRECKAGYRAEYLQLCACMVKNNPRFFQDLKARSRVDAKQELLKIKGIGNKVANMFLLYGLGFKEAVPVDRWILRIVSRVYFNGKKLKHEEVETFFLDTFGTWGGLAQVYLFQGARDGII